MRKRKLSDSFETSGHWWLPESPDKTVAGTLKYSPDAITLELHGVLGNAFFAELGTLESLGSQLQLAYGNTRDGICTLFCLTNDGGFHNFAGIQESTFNVGFVIFGRHLSDEAVPIASVSFDCTRLTEFVRANCFEIKDNRLERFHVGCSGIRWLASPDSAKTSAKTAIAFGASHATQHLKPL